PGDDDHVLLAIGDADVAALVHHAHVAGAQPAVAREDLRGFIRTVPVALHHLRSAQADLAHRARRDGPAFVVEDRSFGARERHADAARPFADVDRIRDRHRRGLGEAVTLHERYAR